MDGPPSSPPTDIRVGVINNTAAFVRWSPPPIAMLNGELTGYKVRGLTLPAINHKLCAGCVCVQGIFVSLRVEIINNNNSNYYESNGEKEQPNKINRIEIQMEIFSGFSDSN